MSEDRSDAPRRPLSGVRRDDIIGAGARLAGRYSLAEPIGRGGMATVYLGHDELLDRDVAVKVLDSGAGTSASQQEFLREARAAAGLTHPNIVGIFDVGVHGSERYIVMEFVAGGSLHDRIQASAPITPARAISIATQLADALGFGHRRGIIHCDVKPQNVLMDDNGRPKLVDFGISRSMAATSARTETITGTAGYIAPEQLLGDKIDGRADVYSLGCVVYEMLSGELPFEAPNLAALATQRLVRAPIHLRKRNPGIPLPLAEAVMRAIERDPDRRYQTALDFARALDGMQADSSRQRMSGRARPNGEHGDERQSTTALPPPTPRRVVPRPRLFGPVALVALCLVILVVALAVLQLPPFAAVQTGAPASVPKVVDQRVDQAANQLHRGGLNVAWQLRDTTGSTICTGQVLSQDPQPGVELRSGDSVSIVVSRNDQC